MKGALTYSMPGDENIPVLKESVEKLAIFFAKKIIQNDTRHKRHRCVSHKKYLVRNCLEHLKM